MIEFKGSHFERDVILWGIRWYVAYPISYRQLEEMLEERGVAVDHSTLNRWVVRYAPLLDRQFRDRKQPVGASWRLDETYVKVKGVWKYLYRAVDKAGATVDFLLTAKRDREAALPRPEARAEDREACDLLVARGVRDAVGDVREAPHAEQHVQDGERAVDEQDRVGAAEASHGGRFSQDVQTATRAGRAPPTAA